MIWFISDTHFGHANIIRYCNRPFASVQEMDETLVANWNAVVQPDDTVWHLGDFALVKGADVLEQYRSRLNGQINLILGNHDRKSYATYKAAGFNIVAISYKIEQNDQRYFLHHSPWLDVIPAPRIPVLHGHVHGQPTGLRGFYDCSVERFASQTRGDSVPRITHAHDWNPVQGWTGRYRCNGCGAFGYKGSVVCTRKMPRLRAVATIFPYQCRQCKRAAVAHDVIQTRTGGERKEWRCPEIGRAHV